ncbi:MAG: hypothetical protein IPQ23_21785 [Cytophagaceae bacterium]|nr:hypothetical protein [Cytophagaceae bacterium]
MNISGINLVMACSQNVQCFENFITSPGSEKSNIIALALVEKGELEAEDVTEALLSDGTTAADGVIDIIRALQLSGKAYYFPNGHLNGKKSKPEEKMASVTYGLQNDPQPTGEVNNVFEFVYEYFYSTQTVKWMNWLRQNLVNYDVVYWTESKVHLVVGKKVTWFGIGHEITGNSADIINGGFSFRYLGDGEPVPYGNVDASKLEGFTKLTITDPTLDALKLAKDTCGSPCNVFTAVAAGTLTTTLDFNVTGQTNCLKWELYVDCGGALPTGTLIDENTGIVTVNAQPANTKRKFRVLAISSACVVGEYCMEIVTKPA